MKSVASRACWKFQGQVKSVASRTCWKFQEQVKSVASRTCWKFQEQVKSVASRACRNTHIDDRRSQPSVISSTHATPLHSTPPHPIHAQCNIICGTEISQEKHAVSEIIAKNKGNDYGSNYGDNSGNNSGNNYIYIYVEL